MENGNATFDSRNNCNAIIETSSNTLIFGCKNTTIPTSVTTIGGSAFNGCSGLTSVTIPTSVTTIGGSAFNGCSGLTSVTIPTSVTTIGGSAFNGCSGLTSVEIPNSVYSIGSDAFNGTPWFNNQPDGLVYAGLVAYKYKGTMPEDSSITIREGTLGIAGSAFYKCSGLSNVTIPESVNVIGNSAFYGCSGLTSVTIPKSVTSIGNYAFSGCSGLSSILSLPAEPPTVFGYTFYDVYNATLHVHNSVVSAYQTADYWKNFTNIVGHSMLVESIDLNVNEVELIAGESLQLNATILPSFAFNDTVNWTTSNGSIVEVNSNGLVIAVAPGTATITASTTDGSNLSATCSVTVVPQGSIINFVDDNVKALCVQNWDKTGDGELCEAEAAAVTNLGTVFKNNSTITSFDELRYFTSLESIGNSAFYGCGTITSITIPSSVTEVGNNAFYGCNGLLRVNVSDLGAWSRINFGGTKANPLYYAKHLYWNDDEVTNLVIPDDVESIGDYAFINCNLTSIKLPESVTFIGKQAFNNSPSIESVTCEAVTPPAWDDIAMFTTNVYNHTPLYVPMGSERAYMADQSWGQFASIIGIRDDVLATSISLNQSQMNLIVNGTSQLVATVLPDSTTNKVVSWSSSAPAIATVDDNGLVTAVALGTATITATTTDGSNLSASCVVTVSEDLSECDNYLSLDDIEAFHGDTIVIPVAMTNAENIIAFQTDIFLPEGLEILQEDGEYMIDPSGRMTRTHSIMSNEVSNGAIRVICYSSNYKSFTGNSGDDLFYITVKVADDAEGDYVIQLKNTLLTNADFVDLAAPDVAATVNVKAYLLGDANNSGTVTVTDVVVTAQYVLELNPNPFVFEAADVNIDGFITVADVSRIAWMVLNPTLNMPRRTPALWDNGDRMSGEGITLAAGETRTVSIALDNDRDYSAFQLDLMLPEGLTAGNFRLTDRAGSHAFDVNTLANGKTRALCYSPALTAIRGNEGALLTFDVTATGNVNGDILVDGIELVTTDCQSVLLDGFTIVVNNTTGVNEVATGKTVAKVEYYNIAGQRIDRPDGGVTLVVTTYTDGTRTTAKIIR